MNFTLLGTKLNPFHVSCGIVLIENDKVFLLRKKDGLHTLPRETAFVNETFEQAVLRGAAEELGRMVDVQRYIGSLVTYFNRPDVEGIEKTTLYFICKQIAEVSRKPAIDEKEDLVLQIGFAEAIRMLKDENNDEYKILIRATTNFVR